MADDQPPIDLPLVVKTAKAGPKQVVEIGYTVPAARKLGHVSRRVFVTRNLLHVVGDVDMADDWRTILCRFEADESPAPPREANLCTVEMLEGIIEQVDGGRARVAKGELRAEQVEEMERRAEAIIDAMKGPGVSKVSTGENP